MAGSGPAGGQAGGGAETPVMFRGAGGNVFSEESSDVRNKEGTADREPGYLALAWSLPLPGCVSARGGWVFVHPRTTALHCPGGEEDTGHRPALGSRAPLQEDADHTSPVLHGPVRRRDSGKALRSGWRVQGAKKGWRPRRRQTRAGGRNRGRRLCRSGIERGWSTSAFSGCGRGRSGRSG